jgi:hypothetical protein
MYLRGYAAVNRENSYVSAQSSSSRLGSPRRELGSSRCRIGRAGRESPGKRGLGGAAADATSALLTAALARRASVRASSSSRPTKPVVDADLAGIFRDSRSATNVIVKPDSFRLANRRMRESGRGRCDGTMRPRTVSQLARTGTRPRPGRETRFPVPAGRAHGPSQSSARCPGCRPRPRASVRTAHTGRGGSRGPQKPPARGPRWVTGCPRPPSRLGFLRFSRSSQHPIDLRC